MISIQILFLLCGVSATFCYSVISDDQSVINRAKYCGKGQIVWCNNFITATECDAVKHCIQTVWLNQNPPFSTKSCDNCKIKVDKFRQTINGNTTKKITQNFLQNTCELNYETDDIYKRCKESVDQFVNNHFNKLLDLLKSDIDPAYICQILLLCNEFELKDTPTTVAATVQDDIIVHFKNIVLHFPGHLFDLPAPNKVLGAEKCTWGPSYWCNNVTLAKECKTISHCIQKVWPKWQSTEDNDLVCKTCIDMIEEGRNELQSYENQTKIAQVIENACKSIEIIEIQKECITLTNKFVPELNEMLSSQMNSMTICTVTEMCHNTHIDNLLTTLSKPNLCVSCSAAFTTVTGYLQRASKGEIQEKLHRLCSQLSTYSDVCSTLVARNFAVIYNELSVQMYPFPICHLSGMCASQYHLHETDKNDNILQKVNSLLTTNDENLPCDLCKQFVTNLKNILTVNTTKNEFYEMFKGICQQMGTFKDDCLQIAEDSDKIYYFLTQELNPEQLCREIDLCPRNNKITDEGLNLTFSISIDKQTSSNKLINGSFGCELCEYLMQFIQKEIEKPIYEHNIERVLESICSIVPREDTQKCNDFVDTFSDVLIKVLVNQTDPKIVCLLLTLCKEAVPSSQSDLCQLCKDVMHLIQDQLVDKSRITKIEDLLKHTCDPLPEKMAIRCKTFIEDYTELIVDVLHDESDPSLVCPALKLCPNFLLPAHRCSHCQLLMADLNKKIQDNRSKSNILHQLATFVPPKQNELTLTALQLKVNHRDDIVDMIGAEFDAAESCTFLQFCDVQMLTVNSVDQLNDISDTSLVAEVIATKPSCGICEMMVQMFENLLTSNATENKIKEKLESFCFKLRNPDFRSDCSHFVKYIPKLINLLENNVKPVNICTMAEVCSSTVEVSMFSAKDKGNCEFCEAIVSSYYRLIHNPPQASRSMQELFHLCNNFDNIGRNKCMVIISSVASQLEIVSIPSWFYCSNLEICPYGAHLTFKKNCLNKTKWCANIQTALLCDKLLYCQEMEWKSKKPNKS